jgi:beta-glucosidase
VADDITTPTDAERASSGVDAEHASRAGSAPGTHAVTPADPRLLGLVERLSLEQKVQLLTGRDFWTSWPMDEIGLRRMLFSDGPSGVRGETWDERSPSLNLPSGTALSAAWDTSIARRYGHASAVEARRKGVDVVLGPTINLHRSPLGGRHFEGFSEDPLLTADLAAAYVAGVQENGVGATPKHYVANDFETERFTADVVVSDRALRELYLAAFEKSVVEARAWLVMSAYNSINGTTASENDLLETPLNSEWGFDGVVISDWTGVRSVDSARASQDMAMPGPVGAWGDALVAAVRAGEVPEEAVDRKVLRILTLAARVGALEGFVGVQPGFVEDGVAFAREAETAGAVLVANDGVLPIAPGSVRTIAVVGDNADRARTQGGGSATVVPESVVSPIDGIREAFPDAEVTWSVGAVVQEGVAELPLAELTNPVTGEPGVHVSFLDAGGAEIFTEERRATSFVYIGGDAPVTRLGEFVATTTWTPSTTGRVRLGFASIGEATFVVDGDELFTASVAAEGDELGAALLAPPSESHPLDVEAGQTVDLTVRFRRAQASGESFDGAMMFTFGLDADDSDPQALIDAAAALAAAADLVVLVVGTNSKVESEGFDRTTLALPGRQDDLARAVLAANPRTVAVVNAGSPVELPWRDDAAAVLLTWFGGQEYGHALADVLTGLAEPGGRLPTTWPAATADVPVLDVTPVDGVVRYDEGIHVGYRAWLRAGATPAWPFGHGLGYTTWQQSGLVVSDSVSAGGAVTVSVEVANTGTRAGKHVVQVYASRPDSAVDRPALWLVGFVPVQLGAGESTTAEVTVPARAFADWRDGAWAHEPGEFTLHVGTSVAELPLTATTQVVG